jgi:hypothetical protein
MCQSNHKKYLECIILLNRPHKTKNTQPTNQTKISDLPSKKTIQQGWEKNLKLQNLNAGFPFLHFVF